MRVLIALALAASLGFGQPPLARIVNPDQLTAAKFQVGDRFEILLSGAANQPVSVRTAKDGHTDWGPAIGRTDASGHFSISGAFEKGDLGAWMEVWTVGGKLANPTVRFSVEPRCLPGKPSFAASTGCCIVVMCETLEGTRSFASPSASSSFRTPDGRVVGVRPAEQAQEQYRTEILENFIVSKQPEPPRLALQSSRGGLGDETSDLIAKLIGVNALSDQETRNVLTLVRSAFDKPETIAPGARQPLRTLMLLRHLADLADDAALKREIDATIYHLQSQ